MSAKALSEGCGAPDHGAAAPAKASRVERRGAPGLCRWFLAALAGLAAATAVAAEPVGLPSHARTELVVATRGIAPGGTTWLAVSQTLDPGWHTYWRNPGDAGEALRLAWTLPPGWTAGPPAWPAPKRLPVGPLMNYGYEGSLLLPVAVRAPTGARPGEVAHIAAKADFLVCAEVCVPASADLALDLPVVAGAPPADPRWGPKIAAALAAVPRPSGPATLAAAWRLTGEGKARRLLLAAAGSPLAGTAARDAYFFPYDPTLIDQAAPQAIERGPRGLTLSVVPGPGIAGAGTAAEGVLVADGKAFEIAARAGPAPPGAAGLGPPAAAGPGRGELLAGLAGALLLAFAGGLVLNLMPCVFPVLSIKAASLAGHGGETAAARRQGLAFLAGVMIAFLALAGALIAARAAGQAVGWGFQLQSPAVVAVLALVMLGAALNLSGVFAVGTSIQGLGSNFAGRGGLIGALMTGVLAVVVAAPCTAPFMGPAVGWGLTQPAAAALAVFATLGLGFAAPLVILAFSPALIRRLPRPGAWTEGLRRLLAFPMYAAAAWLAWVLARQSGTGDLARLFAAALALGLAAWLLGAAQARAAAGSGRGAGALQAVAAVLAVAALAGAASSGARPAGPAATGAAAAEPFSPERLAALRAAGRPVLVNFTAAWCVTCQVNERVALSGPDLARALVRNHAAYLVADWTRHDGAIAAALAAHGRAGVPLYLVYAPGDGPPEVLPQLLTPGIVVRSLDAAGAGRPAGG